MKFCCKYPILWEIFQIWIKLNQAYISRSDSPKGHGLTTNNARIETIKESKLYRPSLETNKRCVVICDGKYSFTKNYYREEKMKNKHRIQAITKYKFQDFMNGKPLKISPNSHTLYMRSKIMINLQPMIRAKRVIFLKAI